MGVIPGLGVRVRPRRPIVLRSLALLALLVTIGGCASSHTVSSQKILQSQWQIDFSGLKAAQDSPTLHATSSPPQTWRALPLQKTALYTHQQWKSPSGYTGAGVLYVHMPLPMNAKMLMWFAKLHYSKNVKDGKLLNEWTDDVGRPWFEGEDPKYHVRGYVVVDGFSAWVVYFGYKASRPINTSELALAARYVQTVVPMTGERSPSSINLADAGKAAAPNKPG